MTYAQKTQACPSGRYTQGGINVLRIRTAYGPRCSYARDIIPKNNSLNFYGLDSLSQSGHQNFLQKILTETFFTGEY